LKPALKAVCFGAALALGGNAAATHLSKEDVEKAVKRCEALRESQIAPLREKAFQECLEEGRRTGDKTEQDCRQYVRDFGSAQGTPRGGVVPRLFHDLPACVEAEEMQQHFFMYPR
jgi:hypothetical protein